MTISPNPARQNAIINYDLPENGKVAINMLSINGNRIRSIYNGYQTKGLHSMALSNSFSTFSNGMYLVQLLVNGKQKIEKLIIEK